MLVRKINRKNKKILDIIERQIENVNKMLKICLVGYQRGSECVCVCVCVVEI